jgi:hypothetical protein
MYDLHRLGVAPTSHDVLGALIKMKKEETKHKQDKHEAAHCI